jgi:hypothetical protein
MKTMRTTKEAKKWVKLVIAAAIAGISLSGCTSIANSRARHMSDDELQLERYQLMRRLDGPRFSSGRVGDDGGLSGDFRRKEADEREMQRRGILDYKTAPHVTYW